MRHKPSLFFRFLLAAAYLVLSGLSGASAEDKTYQNTFETQFTVIKYDEEDTLIKFLWRVTGKKIISKEEYETAARRVDNLVERVMEVLDMRPPAFRIKIELEPAYTSGDIASYSVSKKRIKIYSDRVTDGVFAHEVTHALVSAYFVAPPPEKIQEIMAQYADKHLWEDY